MVRTKAVTKAELVQQVADLEAVLAALQDTNESVKELANSQREVNRLRSELSEAQDEIESLEAQVDDGVDREEYEYMKAARDHEIDERHRLLVMLGMTEQDYEMHKKTADGYLGKKPAK